MSAWGGFATAWLRLLPAETAHGAALALLKSGLAGRAREADAPSLGTRVFGLDFPNPVGLAAGLDKNAEVFDAALDLGFGFVEVGGVTPRPQPGNPKPRLFRLAEDRAIVNRLGFNSDGLAAVEVRLRARDRRHGIVGVNLGKNKDSADAAADYRAGILALAPFVDFLVVNVSSPNTPGLRALQAKAELDAVLEQVDAARAAATAQPPLLLKIAPDMDEAALRDVAAVAEAHRIDGLVCGNTTLSRPSGLKSPNRAEAGGLSGVPLFPLALELVRAMYRATHGRIPILGAGGIASGADAYAMIRGGASLVQLYTALVYQGPGLVGRIKRELAAFLARDGFAHVADAVGAEHR
ncbi:MAG TPA: quinone-dependent dihydroorotate dehydrogenase [Alphaproteobacteria bacterium]|nr:quinone-dependent dihydroorotate dehydrogenase [Alphaproteobacteria bacterium]